MKYELLTTNEDGVQEITGNDPTRIRVLVDMEPFAALELLGLHRIEVAE